MAKNPVGHARTKHIRIHYHFVYEGVQNRAIILKYVATGEMIADIPTKLLPKHPFENLVISTRNGNCQISNIKSGSVVIVKLNI